MNKKKCWRLTVRDEFCSAHALRHYEGKCEHLHGHNFGVEVTVQGEELLPDTELLLDFKVLRQVLKETLDTLDHSVLNETPPFDAVNPSSENLARHIWRSVAERLRRHSDPQARKVAVVSVSVSEKGRQTATYLEWNE